MRLADLLRSGEPTLSFEVFPPKTSDRFDSVALASEAIGALRPDFMSVTYGAAGGLNSRFTLDIAEGVKARYGVPMLTHLTCVRAERDTVERYVADLHARGLSGVMALRGDLPKDDPSFDPDALPFRHASDLIRELRRLDPTLSVGGACYPEVHPESRTRSEDIDSLKMKVDAGCDFLTTQMFFDNSILYNFLLRLREAGVNVPIVAGIMPITNALQVRRAVELSGSHMPQRFLALVDRFGTNPDAMKQAGIAYATDQIIDLVANGVNHIHVYTMNKPDVAAGIRSNLSAILPVRGEA